MIVLVTNEKGGVGKTTLAVNLAALAALAGKEVVLVDADPQQSASSWAAVRDEAGVTPAVMSVTKTGKIGRDLERLAEKYTVVVDSGGRDSVEVRQALAVCDFALIPIRPAQFDVWSLSRIGSHITEIEERTDERVKARAVVNGASPNPSIREVDEVREALMDYEQVFPLLRLAVHERIVFRKAVRGGLSVVELPTQDPKASAEMISLYEEVFGEPWSRTKV